MSNEGNTDPKHHFIGLAATVLSVGLIVLLWSYGLDYLNGTPFEELRYVIFAVVVVGLLSGLQSIFSRLAH
ncbi:hypothetical protein N1937_29130 (plasmid) [Rhizobium sp. WSM4643]|uniref:hypothetical protein n=1 Tax=Rhizobium sp. WSM4643 TaxID=3138253 RepID=UPI0021A6750B|nr:hypothetical protein [Rhizobium leguminosarum]UWM78849.1 hypothetical protein N1937_29130 [Rhizobium leguminosarum bv. viciae]